MRLNRYLAMCGLGSRRSCESIIAAGRVSINGKRCIDLATKVSETDEVRVDDEVASPRRTVTLMLHKPKGYLCTKQDPQGRKTIYDLLPDHLQDLVYVGRLDKESEGLLIMTNDGELAQKLTHPRYKVEKEYLVAVDRTYQKAEHSELLREGVELEEGIARIVRIRVLSPRRLLIVLTQGYKRQIRRMLSSIDYGVKSLLRVRVGRLELGELAPSRWKILRPEEVRQLMADKPKAKKKSRRPQRSGKRVPD